MAAAAVEARPAGALVHVLLAVFARETRRARALITAHQVLNEEETRVTSSQRTHSYYFTPCYL